MVVTVLISLMMVRTTVCQKPHDKAAELTYEQCMDIVKNAPEPKRKK